MNRIGAVILFASILGATPALSFKPRYHAEITSQALPFLTKPVLDRLAKRDLALDYSPWLAGRDVYHFNDCDFRGAFSQLRKSYAALREALRKGNQEQAQDHFGSVLHAVQDFYAHSNWVDLGETALVDDTLGCWPDVTAWKPFLRDLVFVQEPVGVTIAAITRTGRRVSVYAKNGATYRGIISGVVALRKSCPQNADFRPIGHWDDEDEEEGGLHKDNPKRPKFNEAREVAVRQTRHEWCRLNALASGKAMTGALAAWIADKANAEQACQP